VHGFFHSTGFQIFVDSTVLLLAVFWVGLAHWVYRDACRRIADRWLVATATLVGLVPFVGALVYLVFRPPETLADVHARHIEMRALEARVVRRQPKCPVCLSIVEPVYLVCPVCTTRLKNPCVGCDAPLDPLWQACPFCALPIGATIEPIRADLDEALTAEATATGGKTKSRGGSRTARRRAP
jgi:hypothetical protein